MTVPTIAGFVASKAAAWHDRAASRDLWDLWALARHGHFTTEAAEQYKRLGPTNAFPDPGDYVTSTDEKDGAVTWPDKHD